MTIDFQIAPVEPAPTPQTAPAPAVPQVVLEKTPAPAPRELDHTPGGLPAIPLAVITSNTTVAGLSALAVTAGPAAAAATAGTLLVSAVAVRASGRRAARKTPARPAPRVVKQQSPNRQTPSGRRQSPTVNKPSGSGSGGRRSTGSGSTSLGGGRGSTGRRTTPAAGGKSSSGLRKNTGSTGASKTGSGSKPTAPRPSAGNSEKTPHTAKTQKAPKSRAGQIKALRKGKTAAAPTRRERRTKDLADRRNLRDNTRQNKRADRALKKTAPPGPGALNTPKTPGQRSAKPVSPATKSKRTVTAPIDPKKTGKAADTLRPTRADKLRTKLRTAHDQATQTRAARIQQARSKAKARAKLAKTRTGARARYGLKAAGLGLLAAPAGLLGCLTTPLGKWLGWSWLQYPGRRLYRRLTATARYNRDARLADAANTYAHDTNPASLETTDPAAQQLGDTVARAPRTGNTPDLTGDTDMSEDIKLHFLDSSAETVSAAQAYEPGGMLHVRQVIKAMPVALENWAMAFAVLAEKSDAEFPLGDEIGEGLDDIHQQMRQLISHAEDLAQTFDRIHEHDIERLTNPRKSAEAEKTWDTTANEDYDTD